MPNLIFSMNAGCQIVAISSLFHLEKKCMRQEKQQLYGRKLHTAQDMIEYRLWMDDMWKRFAQK